MIRSRKPADMPTDEDSARISLTAHYTGYTWYRHGLSHRGLITPTGRALYTALRPLNGGARRLGLPNLDGLLLARHRALDAWLEQAIVDGRVSQVIEVAAGLSPRGWDFARRHGDRITYIEADLADMAKLKRNRLQKMGATSAHHRVVALDALADGGPGSLSDLAAALDRKTGLAIITEGLLNYFSRRQVLLIWQRFARVLRPFPQGLYLSDLHIASDNRGLAARSFVALLSRFVRGEVHLHFRSALEARSELISAGFPAVEVIHPECDEESADAQERRSARLVRVLRAGTRTKP